jgi:signal transduction histidine kinase
MGPRTAASWSGRADLLLVAVVSGAPIVDLLVDSPAAKTPLAPLIVGTLLVAGACLWYRQRFPVAVVVVCGGCTLTAMALGYRSALLALGVGAALYSLGTTGRRGLSALVAGLAAVVMSAAAILIEKMPVLSVHTFAHGALVVFPVLFGEVVRSSRATMVLRLERADLLLRAERASHQRRVEQERRRIARDLHDVVGHALTTVNVQASVAAHLLDSQPEFARQALREIATASAEALRDVRGLVGMLREPDGSRVPVDAGPRLEDLAVLIDQARRVGVEATLTVQGGEPSGVPESVQVTAYRIVQESLTNIRKHAGEVRATVEVEVGAGEIRLRVWNAAGHSGPARPPGAGLVGMRERVMILGGSLDAGPAAGGGYEVRAHLLLHAGQRQLWELPRGDVPAGDVA